jgi:phage gpG-like protein
MVARDMDRLGIDIRSFKVPLTRSIKRVMIPSIRKNFETGGRPPWEPLASDTVKLRGGSAWPILVRTGKLKKAATRFTIWDISQTSAAVRRLPNNVWYGALHQEGTGGFGRFMQKAEKELGAGASPRDILGRAFDLLDIERGGPRGHRAIVIPQRRFIMYQEDDLDDIQQIFLEWLTERTVRVGRFSAGAATRVGVGGPLGRVVR